MARSPAAAAGAVGAVTATAPPRWRRLLLLPVLLAVWLGAGAGVSAQGSPRCHHTHAYGMLAADCHDVQLRDVPQTLRSDVKALDLTFNRIREVPAGAFDRYSSLELLYLDDNAISFIEDGALEPLTSLRVLSLRLNSLVEVPRSLLQLASLQRLVLARNPLALESLTAALAAARADGPLEVLSLAGCRLRALPPLQRLPRLRELNVSGNPLDKVRASQLAPLCSLRLAVLGDAHSTLDFCDCVLLRSWSERDGLQLEPAQALECAGREGETQDVTRCSNSSASREALALRAECGRTLEAQEREEQRRRLWAYAGGGVGAVAALLALLALCCWCCRRKDRSARASRAAAARDGRAARPVPHIVKKYEEDDDLTPMTKKPSK